LLDLLYASTAAARRRFYERHPEARRRLAQPVISVGNLSVGGTGKTPLVAKICEWLIAQGERPAILTRGYHRANRLDGALVVSDGTRVIAGVAESGDEPFMLAFKNRGCRVVVSEDRHLGGVIAERRLEATVHVLDDGFQHVQLARDLDIVVTETGEIPNGRVLPFGRLREAPAAAARAHLAVVMNADEAAARSEAWALGISQSCGARRVVSAPDTPAPAVAVAGIANPDQFFEGLKAAGWNLARTIAFADHHWYRSSDLETIQDAMAKAGADCVVTTEKDAFRMAVHPLPFAGGLLVARLTLEIDRWETVTGLVGEALRRAREARIS
jgi:tetraacyldisaccharide 4'-kinase